MTIDKILTTPPTFYNQDGKQTNIFDLKLPKKNPDKETDFKFPFIVNSPEISKLESDTRKICSPQNFNDSEKEREIALYHQLFYNHSDSRSPESALNIMVNKTGMAYRTPLEYIISTTTHSPGYNEKLNSTEQYLTDDCSNLEYWYSQNSDRLVNEVVNGLLDTDDDDQLNGQSKYISPLWDNNKYVENSLQGSYIYSQNVARLQSDSKCAQDAHNYITNKYIMEKHYKNNEINFELWGWEKPKGQTLLDFTEKNSKLLEGEYSSDKAKALEAQMVASIASTHDPWLANQYSINNVNNTTKSYDKISTAPIRQKTGTIQNIPDLFLSEKFPFPKNVTYSEGYGLMDNPNGKLSPCDNLTSIYKKYASGYFSINEASKLIDYLKDLMTPLKKVQEIRNFCDDTGFNDNKIDHFSNFLLWYKEMKSRPSSSHYYVRGVVSPSDRNLFVCVTKNGKLDICYALKASNLYFRRGDIVMTYGSNGYDMVAVIEPVIGKKLAHFLQFLKKKLQIDALSTPEQIHNNLTFISDFMRTIRDGNELIDTSRYGLIDMTRSNCFRSRIIRFASKEETTDGLFTKFQDELKILHVINTKIDSYNRSQIRNYRSQIDVKLLAIEIQFDRSKVGIHYIGDHNTDFSSISADIFQIYNIRLYFHAIPNNLGVDEKYFRCTCNEISMLHNMVQSKNLPYVHYDNDVVSYEPEHISRISDYNNKTLERNPTSDKWKGTFGFSAMELDNYYVGTYKQLIADLFN